jgi:hypothetical protein
VLLGVKGLFWVWFFSVCICIFGLFLGRCRGLGVCVGVVVGGVGFCGVWVLSLCVLLWLFFVFVVLSFLNIFYSIHFLVDWLFFWLVLLFCLFVFDCGVVCFLVI